MGWQFPARLLSRLSGDPGGRPEVAPDGGVVVRTPSERDLGYAAAEG